MPNIKEEINAINRMLPEGTRLVAVSKFHPASCIEEAYAAGQRIFGESHVQELQAKHECLPKDIEWHFIGHLQTNKVKFIVPYVSLIHAVDSARLLKEIDKQAAKVGRTIDCLLELRVAARVLLGIGLLELVAAALGKERLVVTPHLVLGRAVVHGVAGESELGDAVHVTVVGDGHGGHAQLNRAVDHI